MEFVFFLAAFGRSDTFQFSTREVIIRLQTNNIRGQVVGIFSITIHTNVYKIPPDEPKQAEADHDAIATTPTILRCSDRKRSLHLNALVTGEIRDNTILNEFLQDGTIIPSSSWSLISGILLISSL